MSTTITMYWNPNNPCQNPNAPAGSENYVTNVNNPPAGLTIGHLGFVSGQSYSGLWTSMPGSPNYNASSSNANGSISYTGAGMSFSPFSLASTNGSDNPLLIRLLSFTAVKMAGYNQLAWKAECTYSSADFVLERSYDGVGFATIDSVHVDGASGCAQPFQYNDNAPGATSASRVYYRLRMIDENGKVTYSQIEIILNGANALQLMSIKPNPVLSQAWLTVSSAQSGKVELVMLSIDGKEIQRKTVEVIAGSNAILLETQNLAKGVYIVRGIFSNGQTNTLPFVKQ